MINKLKSLFSSYKYRFVPWLLLNWKHGSVVKYIQQNENEIFKQEENYLKTLEAFLTALYKNHDETPYDVMKEELGFVIKKRASVIEGAGDGVVVTEGCIKKSHLVALYPGTIYLPMDPIFFQSLKNSFILKCVDGVLVDGNNKGLSRRIFRSCAGRDIIGQYMLCDSTWLTNHHKNPLSIGQIINNESSRYPANVRYHELDIPGTFPIHLMKYIPNIRYKPLEEQLNITKEEFIITRIVMLIAVRDIKCNEELFSSYFTEVKMEK